jgi:hypothetical protein
MFDIKKKKKLKAFLMVQKVQKKKKKVKTHFWQNLKMTLLPKNIF